MPIYMPKGARKRLEEHRRARAQENWQPSGRRRDPSGPVFNPWGIFGFLSHYRQLPFHLRRNGYSGPGRR